MKSKKGVVVTTSDRGVFFGYLGSIPKTKPSSLTLVNARNCIYWSAETRGFLGLTCSGPLDGCRVGPPAPKLTLYDVTSIAECTEEAVKQWEAAPWK